MNSSKPPVNQANDRRTGAQVMAAALQRHGVKVIFGQSLPTALILAAPDFGIRQIGYRTENAGAAMADGYARISHKVPVVTAQNGPAATLLVPGLAEAYKVSVPIVAIVQDVARPFTDKNAFQELNHFDLFRGCTKWIRRVADVDRIDEYVDMAFTAAASGRPGPAVLMVPFDILNERPNLDSGRRDISLGYYPLDRVCADPPRIEQAADLLAKAARPLVIAGGGVHLSDASAELAALQEAAAIPVATTVMGKGAVDERHPLSVGVVGYFMGTRGMTHDLREMVSGADVVLLVGNRTNQNGTDSWSLYPNPPPTSTRHRRPGSGPQLRGGAPRRRCQANARGPQGGARHGTSRAAEARAGVERRSRRSSFGTRGRRTAVGLAARADPARAADARPRLPSSTKTPSWSRTPATHRSGWPTS